jgi:hypothetical protein
MIIQEREKFKTILGLPVYNVRSACRVVSVVSSSHLYRMASGVLCGRGLTVIRPVVSLLWTSL